MCMNFLGHWYYYLGMKTIYNIYESILGDDFEASAEDQLFQNLLGPESAWRVCKDRKHIRMDGKVGITSLPKIESEFVGNSSYRRESPHTIKNIKAIKSAGLEFLPLCYFNVAIPKSDDLLYDIPCEWTANASIYMDPLVDIDFNKVKMECKSLEISFPWHMGTTKDISIIAPKYHVDYVDFRTYDSNAVIHPSTIKGWDCDILTLRNTGGYIKPIGKRSFHDDMQNFYIDKVQEIVDNNPKAKQIYIDSPWGENFLYRCSCKKIKGKKTVVKMVPIKAETIDKKEYGYTNWQSKSLSIHHEYERKEKQ